MAHIIQLPLPAMDRYFAGEVSEKSHAHDFALNDDDK